MESRAKSWKIVHSRAHSLEAGKNGEISSWKGFCQSEQGIGILIEHRVALTCFRAPFFSFCPLAGHPLFLPFSRHLLCSVERCAQRRAWRGAISGWTSPRTSSRNLCENRSDLREGGVVPRRTWWGGTWELAGYLGGVAKYLFAGMITSKANTA